MKISPRRVSVRTRRLVQNCGPAWAAGEERPIAVVLRDEGLAEDAAQESFVLPLTWTQQLPEAMGRAACSNWQGTSNSSPPLLSKIKLGLDLLPSAQRNPLNYWSTQPH